MPTRFLNTFMQLVSSPRSVFTVICWGLLAMFQPIFSQNEGKIYAGFRVSLYGFKMVEQTDKYISVRCNAVNTGREPLHFSKTKPAPEKLIVELDTLSMPKNLLQRSDGVIRTFLREKTQLSPGQIQSNVFLKISLEPEMVEPIGTEKPIEKPVEKPIEKPTQTPTEKPKASTPSSTQKSQPETTKPAPPPAIVEGKCIDLVFDTAFVVEQKGKTIVVNFRIKNIGDRSANLFGETNSADDNLAVNIYFVTGNKITRGSLLAETIFYRDKSLPPDGKLPPDGIFEGKIDVSTKNRSKFSPNLALEIDPFQTLPDCDKTNNTFSILLNY